MLEASSLVNGSSSGMYGESAQGLCLVMWQTLPVSSFKILMQSGVDVRRVTSLGLLTCRKKLLKVTQ